MSGFWIVYWICATISVGAFAAAIVHERRISIQDVVITALVSFFPIVNILAVLAFACFILGKNPTFKW